VKSDFASIFRKKIDEAFEEITYFLGFSLDLALHGALKTKPTIERAVRDDFAEELRNLAIRNQCKPIPSGEWLGRIWLSGGETPKDVGDPVANLNQRFGLYAEALKRGQDKSIGESLAYVLAPLCGTTDITFIIYAARICLGQFEAIRNILESVEIVVKDDSTPAQSPPAQSPRVTAALSNSETAKEPKIVTSPEPTVRVMTTMDASGKETHELEWTAETTRGDLLAFSDNKLDKLNIPQADKDRMKQEIAQALWPNDHC
jgi:hypothetical protein